MEYPLFALVIGSGATAVMDLWSVIRKTLLGIAPPDYGLVGRWLAHMTRGRFRHEAIAAAALVRGELVIGWTAHYLTGIAASRTPRPAAARLQSLINHAVFGLGLYAAGWVTHLFYPS